jgi:hypothetical protein
MLNIVQIVKLKIFIKYITFYNMVISISPFHEKINTELLLYYGEPESLKPYWSCIRISPLFTSTFW